MSQVLDVDSNQSRAVFRLAQLEDSPRQALPLYRRYVRLERHDPWGFMAMGDALADLGRFQRRCWRTITRSGCFPASATRLWGARGRSARPAGPRKRLASSAHGWQTRG